ncbi:allophanate hydrolase [Paenibacillus sp. 32O-W]|uniref:5-oxoprolinase subunit PxpB n=1 Tax=Paenibacillus sp. 32O-W TaxID=1695218 RepID=UPI00071F7FBD|nr:5-oxoprolinase subunit PxpB [Paenibacillus sp. 32O-W]ALS29372.1 allophanate hydrolase [Paenibacillus sp. 32O-W]
MAEQVRKERIGLPQSRDWRIAPAGDRALVLEAADLPEDGWRLMALAASVLNEARPEWIVDIVPAYATVTIVYDPVRLLRSAGGGRFGAAWNGQETGAGSNGEGRPPLPYELAAEEVRRLLDGRQGREADRPRTIRIPVIYGGTDGPDLAEAADRAGMTPEAFVARHAGAEYTVVMIGFMPGFPYLIGLPPELAQPRRSPPRVRVPAGSVGIAGMQTGVYPLATPGGWQIIGRTPMKLFDPDAAEAALLRPGDKVRFVAASDNIEGIG